MKIYAVMVDSWNGEHDVTSVYQVYAKLEDAAAFVETVMTLPEGMRRSSYASVYYAEEIDLIVS